MAGAAGLSAYLGGAGNERARLNEQQQAQAASDAQLAKQLAQSQAQFDAKQQLDQRKLNDDEAATAVNTKIAEVNAGIDPTTGVPYQLPSSLTKPLGPKSTLHDKANLAMQQAQAYLDAHDPRATQALALADSYTKQAKEADDAAAAFEKNAETKRLHDAQINHWSRQDIERAKHDDATVAAQLRNGNLRYDAAMAGVGVRYAAISAANARNQINVDAANRRSDNAIQHADRRSANAIAGANERANLAGANRVVPLPPRALPGQTGGTPYQIGPNGQLIGGPTPTPTPAPLPGTPTPAPAASAPASAPPGVPPPGVPRDAKQVQDSHTKALFWVSGKRIFNAKGQEVDANGKPLRAATAAKRGPIAVALPGSFAGAGAVAGDEDDEDDGEGD